MNISPPDQAKHAVKAALSKVPALASKHFDVERIFAGITNENWLVTVDGGALRYFAKVPGQGTEIFINRLVANEATHRAADAGFGPKVIYVADDLSLEVHEFLEGYRSCNVADMLDRDVRSNVAKAYRDLHAVPLLSQTLTGFDQLRERYEQAKSYGAHMPSDIDHMLWQCARAEAAINAAGVDLSMCFNDAYVTNYMVDSKKNIKIIDLEYATNNDPYWDLALFGAETFLEGTKAAREMIEIHDGTYTEAAEARMTLYYGVALTTWGFWAALQTKLSELTFDFRKYSELLHLRARHQMQSTRWEQALLSL